MKYEFFEDKQFINSKEIPDYVINKLDSVGGLDVVNQGRKIAFCGVMISDGCTYFFAPAKSEPKKIEFIGNLISDCKESVLSSGRTFSVEDNSTVRDFFVKS